MIKNVALVLCVLSSLNIFSFDKTEYQKIANETIKQVDAGGATNLDELMKQQLELVKIGVEGCKKYGAKASGGEKDLMNLVVSRSDSMINEDLQSIEVKWHRGGEAKKAGIKLSKSERMGTAGILADVVVHPATAYIALKEYKKKKSEALLLQVKKELVEVLDHLEHIK